MRKLYIASATATVLMICLGSFGVVRKALAAAAATLVEVVLPAKPYSTSSLQLSGSGFDIFGPGGPVQFGITNITIANGSASAISVELEVMNSCSKSEITNTSTVIDYIVPASSTLVVPFPTPFVTNNFKISSAPSYDTACIGIFYGDAIVQVVGFSQ
jgi:hypothetical protein